MTVREVNAAAIAIAANCEGTAYTAYRDPTGRLTAGQGHTGPDVKPGIRYSQAQVEAWRAADMARAAAFVASHVKVPLNDNQFSALAEFTFNVGISNFAGSRLLRLLNRGNIAAVPTELARWNKGRVNGRLVVLPGLVKRRQLEAELFMAASGPPAVVSSPLATAAVTAKPVPPSLIERARVWLYGVLAP